MNNDVIVCGGRGYTDREFAFCVLDSIHDEKPITFLREGGADGADKISREWADARGIPHETESANWELHGKRAGPIRNQKMADSKPNMCICFPGGKGTADMRRRVFGKCIVIDVGKQKVHRKVKWYYPDTVKA